jgi:hypothetical protein
VSILNSDLVFILLQAIFVLLDSEDPLFACLEKKESFSEALFTWITSNVQHLLLANQNEFPLEGLAAGKKQD